MLVCLQINSRPAEPGRYFSKDGVTKVLLPYTEDFKTVFTLANAEVDRDGSRRGITEADVMIGLASTPSSALTAFECCGLDPGGITRQMSGDSLSNPKGIHEVLNLADQEVERLGHEHLDAGHLLLGLIKDAESNCSRVLRSMGVDLDTLRQQTESHIPKASFPLSRALKEFEHDAEVLELKNDIAKANRNRKSSDEKTARLGRFMEVKATRKLQSLLKQLWQDKHG